MQCLLSLWHRMVFTWVNSWVSCSCSKIVFENLVQEEILIRYISLAAIFLSKHSVFRIFNWSQREIREPDVKCFPKMTSRISKNVQRNHIERMALKTLLAKNCKVILGKLHHCNALQTKAVKSGNSQQKAGILCQRELHILVSGENIWKLSF